MSGGSLPSNLSWTSNSFPMTKEYLYRFSLIHDQDNSQILLLLSIEINILQLCSCTKICCDSPSLCILLNIKGIWAAVNFHVRNFNCKVIIYFLKFVYKSKLVTENIFFSLQICQNKWESERTRENSWRCE